ncbi:hypothetical protein MPTK1_4g03280 [Marchantia polymorpha subsp. ruderalis]|uniref:Uncharacterized protein n=4 Tax=Marchantia polymorpha TaxID=3197 RepID=A0AAF6B5T4_MARPO|nr:hypothetical protein MARPO_2680s0002 [Marchantia polymorpha]BBN07368.1 hypothetical protein Mp_4g03280 [Marchantia polymorpha subsp. ruderalis]|eukprot:PTQ26344.1 hypothetical protein MARPO_2680s0002 [Marchantia polymorpha]
MFDLEDGRGRTPLHVAVDHDAIKEFFSLKDYFKEALWRDIVNRRDAGGTTPVHRTASSIEPPKDLTLLVRDDQTDKALTFGWKDLGYLKFIVDVTKVSVRNGFSKATFEGALASHIACYNPRGAKIMKEWSVSSGTRSLNEAPCETFRCKSRNNFVSMHQVKMAERKKV